MSQKKQQSRKWKKAENQSPPQPTPKKARRNQLKQRETIGTTVHANTVVAGIVHQIMDPEHCQPLRVVTTSDMATSGTALAKLKIETNLDWTNRLPTDTFPMPAKFTVGGPSPILDNDNFQPVVLMRDNIVRFITRVIRQDDSLVEYNMTFCFTGLSFVAGPVAEHYLFKITHQPYFLPMSYAVPASGRGPYGDYHPCGSVMSGNVRVVWIDAGTNAAGDASPGLASVGVVLTLDAAEAFPPDSYNVVMHRWDSEHSSLVVSEITFPGSETHISGVDMNLASSGYYSISFFAKGNNVGSIVNVSVNIRTHTGAFYRHYTHPDIALKGQRLGQGRINGTSLWLINSAPTLALNGRVIMAQLNIDQPWYLQLSPSDRLASLNSSQIATADWKKGAYGYCKPQGRNSYEFADMFETPTLAFQTLDPLSTPMPQFYPFRTGYTIFFVQPTANTVALSDSSVTLVNYSVLEFSTIDQFYEVEQAHIPAHLFMVASDHIRTADQFYENKIHLRQIGAFIARIAKGAARALLSYGPMLKGPVGEALTVARDVNRWLGPAGL